MSSADWQATVLTLQLAGLSTLLLLLLTLPLAWYLHQHRSRWSRLVDGLSLVPLILPPTVLGYYLLLAFHPDSAFTRATQVLGLPSLAFSFSGLVIGSMIYSLPFALFPLRQAFAAIDRNVLEGAACLGCGPAGRFFQVGLPLALPGIAASASLCFAHTLGEFGVVLMLGGSIPGETRVLSIALYEHVEAFEFAQAHQLAAMLAISAWLLSLPLLRLRRP